MTLVALGVIGKIVYLQWVEGPKWRKVAQAKMVRYRLVKATRGNIYSDNGSLLATSLPFYKLAFDPTIVSEKDFNKGIDSLAYYLSTYFQDRTKEEYYYRLTTIYHENLEAKKKHKKQREYIVVNNRLINHHDKKTMETWPIFRLGRAKSGVIFERTDRRYKPFKDLAMRTIGFLNQESHGAGLEYSFNRQLAGRNGEALFQRMAGGNWKQLHGTTEVRPEQGYDIQTTIDINVQDVAEAALQKALIEHQANYGCVLLMEVATGQIKAMANLGRLPNGNYAETYNYAVGQQGRTDPGSTFKLASIIALLEETKISPADSINTGNGTFQYYDRVMNDSEAGGFGTITVQQAFEKSSNIAFVKMMRDHFGSKPQRFIEYLESFGLTRPLGFQMVGEAVPVIKRPNDPTWSGLTLPWMAVGYESKISPLHILSFYNAVANNGKMIQPIIVKEVRVADEVLESYQPMVINEKICSDETLRKVKKMLEGVVERGTARNIRNNDYKIAGKTGTTQKLKNGRYTRSYYTSFVGYFPANKPKFSCIVVIDDPKGFNQHGSDVAAPVFKEIADKVYARDIEMHKTIPTRIMDEKGVFPLVKAGNLEDLRYLCNQMGISNHNDNAEEWVAAQPGQNSINWRNRQAKPGQIPDVTGMTLRDALYILENRGLRVQFSGSGRVVSQSQQPGSRVLRGTVIQLELGS